MSFDDYRSFKVGTVREVSTDFGVIRFVKTSPVLFLVEVALKTNEPFVYSRFTQSMSFIEASCLFDTYNK